MDKKIEERLEQTTPEAREAQAAELDALLQTESEAVEKVGASSGKGTT